MGGLKFNIALHPFLGQEISIPQSLKKKRIEAPARYDVGVLQCYARANSCRPSGP
jgi:hypothetical protein